MSVRAWIRAESLNKDNSSHTRSGAYSPNIVAFSNFTIYR